MTVDSSSSMFQIVSCTLTVKDDAMTAKMTMGEPATSRCFWGQERKRPLRTRLTALLMKRPPRGAYFHRAGGGLGQRH